MARYAESQDFANPLFDLLNRADAGDDLRHQIVELSDAWNGQRLDKLLADIHDTGPAGAAMLARRVGEETIQALTNVRDHVTARRD